MNWRAIEQSVSQRRSLFIWTLCCLAAGGTLLAYATASLSAGHGEFIMPLDDVYIHFQYARQIAAGQPYVYNPGLPPSSGATSLLYPWLLALLHLVGFQGLKLGLGALLLGMAAFAISIRLAHALSLALSGSASAAALCALLFALNGPLAWHFMSGMETGLVILFTLAVMYSALLRRSRVFIVCGVALTLLRPEGVLLPGALAGALFWQAWRERPSLAASARDLPLFLPLLAAAAQPLLNLALTGSPVASGSAAKSIFASVPFDLGVALRRILENAVRMGLELLSGYSLREGWYLLPLFGLAGLLALSGMLFRRERRAYALACLLWLLAGLLAVGTLETAFWHFKRYQMPFFALIFPLAAWGCTQVWRCFPRNGIYTRARRWGGIAAVLASALISVWGAWQFCGHYLLNAGYIYQQPLQMARWLQANAAPGAVVAVHDTGLLRYAGERTTIDMVGLTTPGAAAAWRSGPGAVAEYLMQQQPDYIASYGEGHGFGLGMLAATRIYGQPLASFPVHLDARHNVALAADFQGIYQPDWTAVKARRDALQSSLQPFVKGAPLAVLNVADLESEAQAAYAWANAAPWPGFPTEVYEWSYPDCASSDCLIADGGRSITGEERFTLYINPLAAGADGLLLVTRVHAQQSGSIDVSVNGEWLATRLVPQIPGLWLDVPTYIPPEKIAQALEIRILTTVPGSVYQPYRHALYAFRKAQMPFASAPLAVFQDGAFVLADAAVQYDAAARQAVVDLIWQTTGRAQGDYKVFVHVYGDPTQPPVAQTDGYPGAGTLPPQNWPPGVLHDTIVVDLTTTAAGNYRVAIGLYNPIGGERLVPRNGDASGRVWIGTVGVEG